MWSPLEEVANNNGSGAYTDISVAQPIIDDAMVSAKHLGHFTRPTRLFLKDGKSPPRGWYFLNGPGTASDGRPALKAVDSSTTAWQKAGVGQQQTYGFYTPVVKDLYVVVGGIFEDQDGAIVAEKGCYAVVHKEFCNKVSYGEVIWQDKGSGAPTDGAAWSIGWSIPVDGGTDDTVLFHAMDSYNMPGYGKNPAWSIFPFEIETVDDVWIGK